MPDDPQTTSGGAEMSGSTDVPIHPGEARVRAVLGDWQPPRRDVVPRRAVMEYDPFDWSNR